MQGYYRYVPSWRNYYSGNEYKTQYVRLVLVQTGKRVANAQYQIVDAMQMVVIGLIAGAPSMVQIVKVWADEVLMKIAGWKWGIEVYYCFLSSKGITEGRFSLRENQLQNLGNKLYHAG